MGIEIERKFLVANDGWRAGVVSSQRFVDANLATFEGGKIRVRAAEDRAWIAVKGDRTGLSRPEFEYEIPLQDAEKMLALSVEPTVRKTRHCVRENGLIWSVDVHDGPLTGLILAEIELEHELQPVLRPSWVGREVTHDPRFRYRELLKQPVPLYGQGA